MAEPLLYLVHRIPYPPRKGDKIRSYHLLQHLRARYEVHLGAFVDDPADWAHEPALRELCAGCCLVPLHPHQARLRSLKGLWQHRALTLPYYEDTRLRQWVNERRHIRRVVVFSSAMAQYVDPWPEPSQRLMDFVDVDSDKWAQYAPTRPWPFSWIYRRESRLLLAYERHVAGRFTASWFVSPHETRLFTALAPETADRVHCFENGVDTAYFSPDLSHANPYPPEQVALVMTGAMDYWPNVDAALWFAREIFPVLLQHHPHARFYVVGAHPTPAVRQLAGQDGIVVTGAVEDVRPYLAHAHAVVAPLRMARGVQNKVLEGLAMARPVVATPQAVAGLQPELREHCEVANDVHQWVEQLSRRLASPTRSLPENRNAVQRHHDWERNLSLLDRHLA